MQVQGVDGNTRQVKPGDEIPEAEKWKTREAYVRRGWICLEGQPLNDGATARMVRAIRDRDNDILARDRALDQASEYIVEQNQEIRDRGDRISQLASELEEEKLKSATPVVPAAETLNEADNSPSVDAAPSDTSPESNDADMATAAFDSELNEGGLNEGGGEVTTAPAKDSAPKLSKSELNAMSAGSLQALADDLGIDPGQSKSKLAKAILKAQ